eukprot:497061_1
MADTINIRVTAGGDVSSWLDFRIAISYSSATIGDVIKKAITEIHKQCYPKRFYIEIIRDNSFINKNVMGFDKNKKEWDNLCATPLKRYDKMSVRSKGLNIDIKNAVTHNVDQEGISCKHIKDNDEKTDPLQCPIYKAMFTDGKYTKDNLNHLFEETHFKDEFNQKPKCKHGLKCESFIRLEKGQCLLEDECHTKLYTHPPRGNRQLKLGDNINAFVCNTETTKNALVYTTNDDDYKKYEPFNKDEIKKGNGNPGYINALIEEVIRNGFKKDLFGPDVTDEDFKNDNYTILSVVDNKYHHIRHQQIGYRLNRGQLLALILYTGCDCNYDLCKSQRNGDYNKWKWFDYCLYHAIRDLGGKEVAKYKLFSGLSGVKVDKKRVVSGYFPTYTSSSWNKMIAKMFAQMQSDKGMDKGIVLEIDEEYRNGRGITCCDVSWLSKFPDECEVLIARSAGNWGAAENNGFELNILDEMGGIQTVGLKQRKMTKKEELLDLFGDQLATNEQLMRLLKEHEKQELLMRLLD